MALGNRASSEFLQLAFQVQHVVEKEYENVPGKQSATVLQFRCEMLQSESPVSVTSQSRVLFILKVFFMEESEHSDIRPSIYDVHMKIRFLTPPTVHMRLHVPDPIHFVDVHIL